MLAGQEPWEISRCSYTDHSLVARYPRLAAAAEVPLEVHQQTSDYLAESREEADWALGVEEAQPSGQLRMGWEEVTREVRPLAMPPRMCPRSWTHAHGTSMRLCAALKKQYLCRSLLHTP